ncbi:MAG: hypothetical protein NZ901_12930 [Geminocystis sp.]|nr:hypothetical protein [Geminocystis sp.]MCS7149072.1 hypothetical protein [Geminocystis sp.]MCX8078127.1 hypothetical protein [Geminocystis sp.]MDW8117149.1 hypothetical protein [Geminocystis sp.]MDW8462148.1 hypothetical protein [Geminocystis sp.]
MRIEQIEEYSRNHPEEVLLVKAKNGEEELQIMVYKGISSNLSGATSFDLDTPIIPTGAEIISVDRLKSPYNPHNPEYIGKDVDPAYLLKLL